MNQITATKFVPHNTEAEQQVLGAIMLDGALFQQVADILEPDTFYDPVHVELFALIKSRVMRDQIVTPVALSGLVQTWPGLVDLGGVGYLARMAGSSCVSSQVREYAKIVCDAADGRRLIGVAEELIRGIRSGEPLGAAVSALEVKMQGIGAHDGRSPSVSLLSATTTAVEQANEAHINKGAGVRTGLTKVDNTIGGLRGGDLVIVGGATSMGKTSYGLSIASHIAKSGKGLVIVSLEMPADQLAQRLISAQTNAKYADIRSGRLTDEAFREMLEGSRSVSELPIRVVQPHIRDVASIYSAVKQDIAQFNRMGIEPGGILVDYLQQVRAPGKGRYEQVTEVAIWLKGMAMRLNLPVIALAQLSREYAKREQRRPMLQDIKDSGQIEQEADTVILCHREEYFLEREKPEAREVSKMADWSAAMAACQNTMELHIAKNRAGPIRTVVVGVDVKTNRFWDYNPNDQERMI